MIDIDEYEDDHVTNIVLNMECSKHVLAWAAN
jgi:hypothetical protein